MGISGGKKVKTTSQETATTTPNIYGPAQQPAQDYFGNVSNFMDLPASSLVTPANNLQTQAFNNAANLGGQNWDTALNGILNAKNDLNNIGDTNPSYASIPTPYKAANVAGMNGPSTSQASLASLGPVTQAGSQGYSAPQLGNAQNVSLGGYDAAQVGDAGRFLGNNVERVQGQSLLDNLQAYLNPATENLVDATLAETDDYNGRQMAAQRARMAGSGAFGGSRSAIAESQLLADQGRNRSLTDAELRYGAFNTATGLSNLDAGRRQDAGIFNAGSQNQRDELRGQMGFQGDIFNAGARNDASRFGADARNTGSLFNAGAANDFRLSQAGFDANAAQFGANAANTAGLANAGAANQYGLAQFDAGNQTNRFNSTALNDASNLQYSNEAQNARQNAQSANDVASQIYGTTANNNQFNANQFQDSQQFNTNTDLQKAIQAISASGQYADILGAQGQSDRADTALQGDLGQQQWNIENQATQAPLIKMLADQGLLDPSLIAALSGQTINSSGTGTSKESGGLISSILSGAFGLGAAALGKK